MENKGYLSILLRSPQTVFSFKDIAALWNESATTAMRVRVNYYVKNGELYPIRRGIYAKDKNYDRFEAATKIYAPSYISFETVLTRAGVIFRRTNQVFIASYLSREITADGQTYLYRKIKDTALKSGDGIERKGTYGVATPERAFLDLVYLSNKNYHFDNLSALNWEKVFELLPLYQSDELKKRVDHYYQLFQQSE